MGGNTIGKTFKVTSFGESHGICVGVVIDGCPPGLEISKEDVQKELDKRKPGQSKITTSRKEQDKVEILSGIFNGFTTGAPICMLVWNKDVDSSKYKEMRFTPRPSHADYTAYKKYGGFNDYRGGGRFSGRITAGFVMAGAVAKKILEKKRVKVLVHTVQVGDIFVEKVSDKDIEKNVYSNSVRCADLNVAKKMENEILKIKKENDSIGGIVECRILNVPVGLGEPVFDSLESLISHAMFSIPAVKGIEFGSGFKLAKMKGSEANDEFRIKNGKIITKTNHSGGILGGISNGMPIVFRVVIKPTPSIGKRQETVNLKKKKETEIYVKGRHDPCIVPRVVPVVETMTKITLADYIIGDPSLFHS